MPLQVATERCTAADTWVELGAQLNNMLGPSFSPTAKTASLFAPVDRPIEGHLLWGFALTAPSL